MKIVIAVDGSEAARKALLSGLARAEGNVSNVICRRFDAVNVKLVGVDYFNAVD